MRLTTLFKPYHTLEKTPAREQKTNKTLIVKKTYHYSQSLLRSPDRLSRHIPRREPLMQEPSLGLGGVCRTWGLQVLQRITRIYKFFYVYTGFKLCIHFL